MNISPKEALSKLIKGLTLPFIIFGLMIIALPFVAYIQFNSHAEKTAIKNAKNYSNMMVLLRNYYAQNVMEKVVEHPDRVIVLENHQHVEGAIPLATVLVKELSQILNENNLNTDIKVSFASEHPTNKSNYINDDFQKKSLDYFKQNPKASDYSEITNKDNGVLQFRFSVPIKMNESCVNCHNQKSDTKNDWTTKELDGIQEISVSTNLLRETDGYNYLIIYIVIFTIVAIWALSEYKKNNSSLKDMNDALLENHYEQGRQKIQLQQLVEELEVMKTVIENATFGVCLTKANVEDYPLTYVNKQFTKITGYSANEVLGKNCRFLQGEKTDKQTISAIKNAIHHEYPYETDILNYKKDGTTFWNHFLVFPVYNAQNELIYFVGCQTDITDIKNLEEEQQRMSGEILEAQKLESLGVTIAGIAHDLNTPIGVAMTSSTYLDNLINRLEKLVKENPEESEKIEKALTSIKKTSGLIFSNLTKSAQLVKSFKETTADATRKEWRKININSFLDSLFVSLSPIIKRSHIHLTIKAPKDINTYIEPGALGQLITNLIINASVHAFEGIEHKEIQVEAIQIENKIQIYVKDNGTGVDQEVVNKMFTPFFTTKRNQGSSGLGLFSSKRIAQEILNGNLEYKPNEPNGTIFIITIPIVNSLLIKD